MSDSGKKDKKRGGKIKEIKEKLKEKEREYNELRENMLRLQADFENYQKHMERERERFVKLANQNLIRDLLDIIDGLEMAISSLKKKDEESAKGFEMIYKNLMKILENHGLMRIDAIGKKFDPYYHEVVMKEKSDKEEGTIIEELQKGYMLNLNVIRHSKVKIASKKEVN
ncbi:MAG: nucleotide exchange factor GrpE [Candidatus Altiarchaeales archaeon]|nr:MAG: nucleotide exchange factor GrpE [Candidatus Altiarchaeales archaeon]